MEPSDVNLVTSTGYSGEIGFVLFIDDFSRLFKVYCIKSKLEVVDKFINYINTMSILLNREVKIYGATVAPSTWITGFMNFVPVKKL